MALRSRTVRLAALLLIAAVALATASAVPPARAQDAPQVAYVYNSDTVSRDSFKAELELRGFAFTPITLAEANADAPDPDFSQYDVIIIAHDTGDVAGAAGWLGGQLARDRIVRAMRYTVGIGFGGAQFFDIDLLGLQIGFSNGITGLSRGVQAVNPGDPAWLAPNAVPLAPDGSVRLYTGEVGGRFANPDVLTNVTLIGRVLAPGGDGSVYPLAAELNPQLNNTCYLLWGHRGAPAFMTPEGRDTLENLLRDQPCDSEQNRPRADVAITKSAPKSATVGQNLTYTMVISNNFRLVAPQVMVEDTLPANTTLVSVTPSQGSCRSGPRRVVCALGDLAGGASATVTLVVKPTEVGTLVNVARAGGRFEDLDPNNNRAEATTEVGLPSTTPVLRALPYKPLINEIIYPVPVNDLSIHGIEITQGIQCFDTSAGLTTCPDNSLPMVNRKSTVARIYLRVSGASSSLNNVPVRLVLIDANNVEYVVNTVGKALTYIDRANASSSANVYFTVNFNGTVPVRYYAIVDPNGTIAETNESNNRFPTVGTRTINFTASKTMKIIGQRLRYHPSGYTGTQYAGGWAVNGGAADWFEQLLPIRNNGITYQVASGYLNWTTTLNTAGQHALIGHLNNRWIMQNVFAWLFGSGAYTGARHVYGWAPNAGYSGGHADMPIYPHAGGLGVVGIGTDRVGSSPSTDNPGGGALIFGHELVHDYNIMHTNTSDSCGSSDSNSNFPYSSSSIQEFGFNPVTGKVYNPSNTHDLMSYCPAAGSREGWISPYTWQQMFNKLSTSSTQAAVAPSADGSTLIVDVTVSNPSMGPETGTFNNLMKVDVAVPSVTPAPGDYAIDLLNASNTILSTTTFSVTFKSEYTEGGEGRPGDPSIRPYASASMNIPWVDGTTQIRLRRGATQLKVQTVSANPPQVQFTSPAAAATWPAGTVQTLTWQGIDPDTGNGNGLTYSLFYSHNGVDWALLESGITDTSYQVAVDSLAGGTAARFRIVASDGVLIGDDETDFPINVPDKAPTAYILNPTTGSTALPGDLVVLSGFGNDFEDGTLPELSLSWKSDRQGDLGTGEQIATTSLDAGLHKITLTVTDSKGQTSTATAEIFIGTRLLLPVTIR